MRLASLLIIAMLVQGCAVKLAYNNADRFARWQTSDYIRMTPEQRQFFDARFDELWYWHRTTQLPRYAEYLDMLAGQVEQGFDDEAGAFLEATVQGWFIDGVDAANPLMAELLMSLSDEQIDALAEAMERSNLEFRDEDEEFDLVDSVQDGYRRFIGRLSKDQKLFVEANSDRYRPVGNSWIAYRERWQGDLLELIRRSPPYPEFLAELRVLTLERERWFDADVAAIDENNTALFRDIGNEVFSTLTERQRSRAIDRIRDYARIFEELAAQADEQAPPEAPCLARC